MELLNVKGTNDYSPKEQRIRNYISNTLKETFEEYGYQPLETPIVCYYDLLTLKYDENNDIIKEIYRVKDQGDRDLALRYDLTVPFAKYIAMNKGINMPFKRYEIGNVYRDGPIKLGRNREFVQCDVDVVGIKNVSIEAELMSLYIEGFKKLGIDSIIKYNNRKLLTGIINECNINNNIKEIITLIDKKNKISKSEMLTELANLGVSSLESESLLHCFDLSFEEIKNNFSVKNNKILIEGIAETEELNKYINKLEIKDEVKFDLSLARGQEYYTGVVFEAYAKNSSITSSIGGGGRYDKMITNFIGDGNEYPAVGISFGLNVLYEILSRSSKFSNQSLIDLYIIPMDTGAESLMLANKLRKGRIKVDIEMRGRKINKALDFANKNNIPYVIILGQNEIDSKKIKLKSMKTSSEKEFSMEKIEEIIEEIRH